MPDFDASPERLTSTSAGIVSRRAADSLASEWQSSQSSFTVLALRLCRWPMKCQRNASPWRACLASRSWARFSPTTSMPASARPPSSSTSTYFVAATIVTCCPPSSAWIRSRFERMFSADNAENALDSTWLSGSPVREEELRVAGGADVEAVDARDSGRAQRALGSAPQVEIAPAQDAKAEPPPERL